MFSLDGASASFSLGLSSIIGLIGGIQAHYGFIDMYGQSIAATTIAPWLGLRIYWD